MEGRVGCVKVWREEDCRCVWGIAYGFMGLGWRWSLESIGDFLERLVEVRIYGFGLRVEL